MTGPLTPNFQIQLPQVNGDANVWGEALNKAFGEPGAPVENIDTLLQANLDSAASAQTRADAMLPKDGSEAMIGLLQEHSATLKTVDLGAAPSVVPMDLGEANFFLAQPAAVTDTQYVFANVPQIPNVASIVFLQIKAGGSSNVMWDPDIIWPSTIVITLSTIGTDLVGFITPDQGATWYGSLVQRDVR